MTESANCLSCHDTIAIDAKVVLVGEIVQCTSCGQEHEVLRLMEGLQLGLAPEVEEDWGE